MGLLLGLTAVLSAVNVAKMSILAEPLFPSDYQFLRSADFLVEMVEPGSIAAAAAALVLLVVGTTYAARAAGRRYPRLRRDEHPRGWLALVVLRVVVLVVAVALLSSALASTSPATDGVGSTKRTAPSGSRSRRR